ncbi:Hypothetical predicted protein, partial [Paramuricea clavata]
MDKAKYTEQVNEMLGDQTVYTRITDKRRNPTKRTETDLENILKELRRSGNITDREYWQLRAFDSSPATFYGLPKVHKVSLICNQDHYTLGESSVDVIPLRPINSNIGSPTYSLSKYLAKLLKTFCAKNEFSISNGKEFADFAKSQTLGTDETIVSFDVVSLFTSIPVPFALHIVQKKLKETDSWKSHTALKEEQVVKLLKFLLNNCYFKFNETHYHQKSGCAMGSP